jgi:(R)-2-hydroxyacyl-CoA dehydratese activating ATPase
MICGIDLGSRSVKMALFNPDTEEFSFRKYDTIDFYRQYGKKNGDKLVIEFDKLGLPHLDRIVSTGYGRNTLNLQGGENIPELKAHTLGAVYQTGLEDFTVLDLGGQDSKVIKVKRGKMVDFQTNDKCAASSGRYLENMANTLGITIEELSKHYHKPVELNATCAIFGESEIIGRIIEGHSMDSLAAGVNYTIFRRVQPMLVKILSDTIVFTGGVAHNQGLQHIIKNELGVEVVVPKEPQYNGAIGCICSTAV